MRPRLSARANPLRSSCPTFRFAPSPAFRAPERLYVFRLDGPEVRLPALDVVSEGVQVRRLAGLRKFVTLDDPV